MIIKRLFDQVAEHMDEIEAMPQDHVWCSGRKDDQSIMVIARGPAAQMVYSALKQMEVDGEDKRINDALASIERAEQRTPRQRRWYYFCAWLSKHDFNKWLKRAVIAIWILWAFETILLICKVTIKVVHP